MDIFYSDVQRGSDYMGTKIVITSDNKVEWKYIQGVYLNKIKQHKGSWFYRCDTMTTRLRRRKGKHQMVIYSYDGFLASLVEQELTGDRVGWLGMPESILEKRIEEKRVQRELSQC